MHAALEFLLLFGPLNATFGKQLLGEPAEYTAFVPQLQHIQYSTAWLTLLNIPFSQKKQ